MKSGGVGLALGGGAARGLAHIGVLQVLTEAGVRINRIAGTSIGAIVGALFAAGLDLNKMEQIVCSLKLRHVLDFDFVPGTGGIIRGQKLRELLSTFLGRKTFADLNVPLAVVATDLWTGDEVVLDSGWVVEAVLASSAIPGVFVPVVLNKRPLCDGGLINRVPAQIVKESGTGPVVAIDVGPGLHKRDFRDAAEVMMQAIDIMQEEIQRIKVTDIDVYIRPDVGHMSAMHLYKAAEIIDLGRQAGRAALPQIHKLL